MEVKGRYKGGPHQKSEGRFRLRVVLLKGMWRAGKEEKFLFDIMLIRKVYI